MEKNYGKFKAFTLAEVLITLAIIGVVAALTIPTVITNYQKKMYVTQLKKTYNNLSNGFKTMMAREGVTKLADTSLWSTIPGSGVGEKYSDDLYDDFFKEFSKTFNTLARYGDDDVPEEFDVDVKCLNGEEYSHVPAKVHMADGSWVYFYLLRTPNSNYRTLEEFQKDKNTPTKFWEEIGQIFIDVNGTKLPNTHGRDIFYFYIGNDGTLYPNGGKDVAVFENGCNYDSMSSCSGYWRNDNEYIGCSSSTQGFGCAARIMEEGWEMNY